MVKAAPLDCTVAAPNGDGRLARIVGADGLGMTVEAFGPERREPALVFAHGFGQTRHAWRATARALGLGGHRALSFDARGHGDSDWRTGGAYQLDDFVGDIQTLVTYVGIAPVWIGASLGGLLGMLAEAERGPLFRALILVDITPRWEKAGAERILDFMRAHPQGFADLAAAQVAIEQYLPHRASGRSPERLRKLLVPGADGRFRWHWDPALLECISVEAERSPARLANAARALRLPVLLISGGRSDVVSPATIAEFQTLVPHAEHVCLDDATHMVAGDVNDGFTAAIDAYLQRLDAAAIMRARGAHVGANDDAKSRRPSTVHPESL